MEYYKKRKKEIVESILSTISDIRDNEYNKIEIHIFSTEKFILYII